MTSDVRCEQCGGMMEPVRSGGSVGWQCPACGCGFVTTDPMLTDPTVYTVELAAGNAVRPESLRAIAACKACGYRAARELVLSAPCVLWEGRAMELVPICRMLTDAGIAFTIRPELPDHLLLGEL